MSCYPSYDRSTEDQNVVITIKTSNHFTDDDGQSAFKSFFLADTIIHLADSLMEEGDPEFPGNFDDHILQEVKNHFKTLEYNQIMDTLGLAPDVLISVSALAVKNTEVYFYFPDYWWGGGY